MRAVTLLVLAAVSGCAAEKMATRRDLTEIPIDPTSARALDDEALWMGDFALVRMNEEPIVSRRSEGRLSELRGYTFTLIDREGTSWSTRCRWTRQMSAHPGSSRVDLTCAIESDGVAGPVDRADLALFGRETGGRRRSGELHAQNLTLEIRSAHEVLDGRRTRLTEAPVGFEIRLGDLVVGAVQTTHPSIFWLDRRLPSEKMRALVGASAAALLLFDRGANE